MKIVSERFPRSRILKWGTKFPTSKQLAYQGEGVGVSDKMDRIGWLKCIATVCAGGWHNAKLRENGLMNKKLEWHQRSHRHKSLKQTVCPKLAETMTMVEKLSKCEQRQQLAGSVHVLTKKTKEEKWTNREIQQLEVILTLYLKSVNKLNKKLKMKQWTRKLSNAIYVFFRFKRSEKFSSTMRWCSGIGSSMLCNG